MSEAILRAPEVRALPEPARLEIIYHSLLSVLVSGELLHSAPMTRGRGYVRTTCGISELDFPVVVPDTSEDATCRACAGKAVTS